MIALVVEDIFEDMLRLVDLIEDSSALKCESCNSGEVAIKFLENRKVDIVFINFKLRDMPGLTLLEILKRIQPNTSYVMVGPTQKQFFIDRVLSLGGDDYLPKPISSKAITKLMTNILVNTA